MPMYIDERLAKASPNLHHIELVRRTYHDDPEPVFYIFTSDDEWEFDNEPDAREKYEELLALLRQTPNWEAQAEYDACYGEPICTHRPSEY